jgi:hypothetical protein
MVVRTITGAVVACLLFALALWTGELAKRSGRSEFAWTMYGLLVPVISYLHIVALARGDHRG